MLDTLKIEFRLFSGANMSFNPHNKKNVEKSNNECFDHSSVVGRPSSHAFFHLFCIRRKGQKGKQNLEGKRRHS